MIRRATQVNLACVAALIALNVWLAWRLFSIEYTIHTASLDGVYIALARFILANGPQPEWLPWWRCGIPFEQIYQPLFHIGTALIAKLSGMSVARAYHFLVGLTYALGPATLYWMTLRLTRSTPVAFSAGLLYSLISPSALLVPLIALDLGGSLYPRRLHTAFHYSDTPHIAALTLLPLVIVFLDRARERRSLASLAAAVLFAAAVILTNIPATIVLAMALAAYALAYATRDFWWQIAAVPAVGGAIAIGWFPPSVMRAIVGNLQRYEPENRITPAHYVGIAAAAIVLAALAFLLRRTKLSSFVVFAGFFFALVGGVTLANYWFDITILAQPRRFQIAMEIPAVMLLAAAGAWLARSIKKLPDRSKIQLALFAIVCTLGAFQIANLRGFARRQIRPIDATYLSEYRTARWLEANAPGQRVYAAGSTMFWLNAFSDVPQVTGCCEQSIALPLTQIMRYTLGTDDNAGNRKFEFSLAWLQAFGANFVIVPGPSSTDAYAHDWSNPHKFEGRLKEVSRDGGNIIYKVPQRSRSLAHPIRPEEEVRRIPGNGLDIAPMLPYVNGIEDPSRPELSSEWKDTKTLRVRGELPQGMLVSVQIPFHKGWRAILNGRELTPRSDELGFLVLDPQQSGAIDLQLSFDGWTELKICRTISLTVLSLMAAGLVLLGVVRCRRAAIRSAYTP